MALRRGAWLAMSRIACGFPPTRPLARRIACPISMGHYQRSLVLRGQSGPTVEVAGTSRLSQARAFTTLPGEPRNDRVQHSTDFAKDVRWHGLSRARRPPFRRGEVLDVGIHARTFYRTCSRIELPGLDFLAGSVGVGFSLSGFLRRFRLCPLAGLSFGHVFFAFPSCFVEL